MLIAYLRGIHHQVVAMRVLPTMTQFMEGPMQEMTFRLLTDDLLQPMRYPFARQEMTDCKPKGDPSENRQALSLGLPVSFTYFYLIRTMRRS
ncbi:MAG: hypothetical protein LKE41_06065 [Prevotella sp.]|nr:hypothetical protein [Prevotella sp.]MCI2080272.1 hypothetical protein [Prevotella sp.]MCI2101653.1 hypothetical protein [Prevotella sp.]